MLTGSPLLLFVLNPKYSHAVCVEEAVRDLFIVDLTQTQCRSLAMRGLKEKILLLISGSRWLIINQFL